MTLRNILLWEPTFSFMRGNFWIDLSSHCYGIIIFLKRTLKLKISRQEWDYCFIFFNSWGFVFCKIFLKFWNLKLGSKKYLCITYYFYMKNHVGRLSCMCDVCSNSFKMICYIRKHLQKILDICWFQVQDFKISDFKKICNTLRNKNESCSPISP